MIQGTLTFSQGMSRVWVSMLTEFRNMLIQMLLEWVKHEADKLIISLTTNQQQTASSAAAAAQQSSISLATTLKEVSHAAVAGAAKAYEAMAGIPIVGPILGAAAAAATFSAIMAFGALASAAGGMDEVPHDMIMQVHKSESVMSPGLSSFVRNAAASASGQGGGGGNGIGGSSSRVTNNHFRPIINVTQNGGKMSVEEISSAVNRGMRAGSINLTKDL
jgi:hypothetical protein